MQLTVALQTARSLRGKDGGDAEGAQCLQRDRASAREIALDGEDGILSCT